MEGHINGNQSSNEDLTEKSGVHQEEKGFHENQAVAKDANANDEGDGPNEGNIREIQEEKETRNPKHNSKDTKNHKLLEEEDGTKTGQQNFKKTNAKRANTNSKTQGKTSSKPGFDLRGLNKAKMTEYDGLRDGFLQPFFSSGIRKEALVRNGLVTNGGFIVKNPEVYLKKKELHLKDQATGVLNGEDTSPPEKPKDEKSKENSQSGRIPNGKGSALVQ
jgi:hypothetical protein